MKSFPTDDPRILEALEACRPGSDDLQDPAMEPLVRQMALFPDLGELYGRLQDTDRAVAEAFARVPVPAGLAERVLDRLRTAETTNGIVSSGTDRRLVAPCVPENMPTASVGMAPQRMQRRRRRRVWLVGAGVVAVAASLLLVVLLHSTRPSRLSVEEVLDETIAFFNNDARTGGTPLGIEPLPPASYPLSGALPTRNCQVRWRWVDGLLDSRGVAYDIVSPSGIAATLYVVPLTVAGAGSSPPGDPRLATGRAAAAWQERDRLYVLVVEGESRAYGRLFLDSGAGPVT